MRTFDPQSYQDLLEEVLEKAHECIVVTDPDGFILLMNRRYREFLGVDHVVGKHVTEVIPNTRMHIVGKSGKAEIAEIQRIHGQDMIANRVPIFKNGKLVAVLGTVMFQDVRELHALAATVDQLKRELAYYKRELRRKLGANYHFENIIGSSPKMQAVKKLAQKVAKSDTTVLITGESGTGKELFAHAIHAASRREMGPFIRVNCAAIPDTLLESELFGYEAGAFTGALQKGKKGKFELANHGTILLDEIGDMPLTLQAKLLRVLQEKEVERLGGTKPISIDVRIIASTHRDLRERIREGKFREDLFYRLNVVTINIPPLRERLEDLPELVHDLLDQLMESTGIHVRKIEEDVWDLLSGYSWPGNVRELRNALESALHLMEGDCLKADHFLIPQPEKKESTFGVRPLRESIEEAEKEAIVRALAATVGNKLEAAKLLGISKSSFYQKLEKYGL
ncbi:sigma-54-dependent Fis family transcriptional regulator [Collibacillus ludicampi]|uniref:Sigma-54-dependent Fis family transcriptional regulator n=1 Tax=Collibacillus ludicampi TaxID=2771369 RepID=A0AAV4LCN7_9BACL|nr:sigma 54-interacting transcriptional regulator [Collibacillus ludicampi]GIM45439.1 sigma-54-dependent Fis family transcriptional regulator [Collibacillus ludicampi]